MKAFIHKTFVKENFSHSMNFLKTNSFFTNNRSIISDKSIHSIFDNPKNHYSSLSLIKNKNQGIENFSIRGHNSIELIKLSKKDFSRNSTQWLKRHTTDVYVKKSVEVYKLI